MQPKVERDRIMIPKEYRWILSTIGWVWLLGAPFLAIWTWVGAALAITVGLIVLKGIGESIEEEKQKKRDEANEAESKAERHG